MGFLSLRRDENLGLPPGLSVLPGGHDEPSLCRKRAAQYGEEKPAGGEALSLSLSFFPRARDSVGLIGKQLARRTVRSRCEKGTHSERTRGIQADRVSRGHLSSLGVHGVHGVHYQASLTPLRVAFFLFLPLVSRNNENNGRLVFRRGGRTKPRFYDKTIVTIVTVVGSGHVARRASFSWPERRAKEPEELLVNGGQNEFGSPCIGTY